MCECGGWLDTAGTIICEGCEYWRTQHGIPCGPQHPCKEKIGKAARSANRNLCHYCNDALIKHTRAQTPPLATTPPPHPPTPWQPALPAGAAAVAATPPLATTPPPHPPTQWQPALPTGAAAAAALGDAIAANVDANSQSSRGSVQQPMPATADATPQLNHICARLDALEEICGRMETMMTEICAAIAADGAQSRAQAAVNMPPGLADGAQPDISQAMAALDMPPGLAALAQPRPQAAAPLQAQAAASVVAVNVPGADNGGQGSHASWTAGVQPSHSPIHPQPHKNTKHNLNKHKSNNHRHRQPLKLMREV